jgi:hypothetical protein
MDPLQMALVALSFTLFLCVPGFLLHRMAWRRYSFIESLALAFGFNAVLISLLTLFFGYHEWLMLVFLLCEFLILAILALRSRARNLWTRPRLIDALFLAVPIIVFFSVPLISHVPFGVDSQGFGYIALMVREGGSITTLAPWHPEITWAYSPAFFVLTAFFSQITGTGIHVVMPVIAAVVVIFMLLLAYEFGKRVQDRRFGLLLAACMVMGTWLFTAYLDSHYTVVFGTFLMLIFVSFLFKSLEKPSWQNLAPCSLMLAAVLYVHPDTLFHLLIAFIPFMLLFIWWKPAITWKSYLKVFIAMPALAVLISAPYLVYIIRTLVVNSFSHAQYYPHISHLGYLLSFGGFIVPVLGVIGLYYSFRRRRKVDVLMLIWFVAVIEFSSIGFLNLLFSNLPVNPFSLLYPFGIAWHAPIIPFSFLAAMTISAWCSKCSGSAWWRRLERQSNLLLSVLVVLLLLCVALSGPLIRLSKTAPVPLYGEWSSTDDVKAMLWLKDNTPKDSLVLNFPAGNRTPKTYEGHWVPVIAERDTVDYRHQVFFFNEHSSLRRVEDLVPVILDPASESSRELVDRYGIDYIIVPQVHTNPEAFSQMLRWRPAVRVASVSRFSDAAYLELVFDSNGAQVYRVKNV